MSAGDADYLYEREAEYYGFTPFQLLDRVGAAVVAAVFDMFARLERDLARAAYLTPGQASAGLAQWSALVEARFGRNYEFFEAYIVRNVLCLPDAFVPPHRRVSAGEPGEAAGDGAISALLVQKRALLAQRRVFAAQADRLAALEARAASLEAAMASLRGRLSSYGAFEQTASALGDHVRVLQAIAAATLAGAQRLAESPDADAGGAAEAPRAQAQSPDALDAELAQCARIATLADLQFVATVSSPSVAY